MTRKGQFTISIDTELAWGTFDHGGHATFREAYQKCRPIIHRLIRLFETYEISATWAIVGHLFLDHCRKENGRPHPDIARPKYDWYPADWFSEDPATDLRRAPAWYGKDIVDSLNNARVKQEIASHSFSHVIFSDPGCSAQTAESEIAKCVSLAKEAGITLKSFVFPRNQAGHLDLLAKYGFSHYRHHEIQRSRSFWQRGVGLLKDMLPITPPVVSPRKDPKTGLIGVPASFQFRYAYGYSRWILPRVRYWKAEKGIQRAIREKKLFHLWLHPMNFAWKTEALFEEFEQILKFAARQRKEGRLDILPMKKILLEDDNRAARDDAFNEQCIPLHDQRARFFSSDYAAELADYHRSAFKYGRKKIMDDFNHFIGLLNPGDRILDVGCGTGFFMRVLKDKGFDVTGVDLSQEMVKKLKQKDASLDVRVADAKNLPFEDRCFDAVISVETLRYFQDRSLLLKELSRVLKPKGVAFITAAPLWSSNLYGLYNAMCRGLGLRQGVSCYQSFETKRSLSRRLSECHFDSVTIQGHFFGPYFILDKIAPALSRLLMKKIERLDDALSGSQALMNFTNHFVAVARKS